MTYGYGKAHPESLNFIGTVFDNVKFVKLHMPEHGDVKELIFSAFIYCAESIIKTSHYIKLDADTYFTTDEDVFASDDFDKEIVGHSWGYTKPGWWVDVLEGKEPDKSRGIHKHQRIASFCCLHKTSYMRSLVKVVGDRLPIPSHDTVSWFYSKDWRGKNLKKLGVHNSARWKSVRESVCISPSVDNNYHNSVLMDHVQLEVTTKCNIGCHNCDRNCGVAPSDECMSLEQIWKFVEETVDHEWKRIDIIGGEPTLYPDLEQLFKFIKIYKNRHPGCRIRFSTNGVNGTSVPGWVSVRDSSKHGKAQEFTAYNSAPIDNGENEIVCCSVPWRCGIALTRYGYFLCGAGASIARVFGFNIGIKNFRDVNPRSILDQKKELCKYCGHSRVPSRHMTTTQEISPSWKAAIKNYRENVLYEY